MDIAFIRPTASANAYINNVPLNYTHLAAYLREHGHGSTILDMVLAGTGPDEVDAHIRDRDIRVAGIGCMTCELPDALAEARRLKATHPGIKVVFGGAHPSGDPEECLASGVVDYVVVGEGEIPLVAILDQLAAGGEPKEIQGVWTLEAGKVTSSVPAEVPFIETLPDPAYDILDMDQYYALDSPWHFPKSPRAVQFISSRGCPYRCSYCHTIHGKKYRGLSPTRVVDQMERLVREEGVGEFMMVDDIFNFDLDRAKEICRQIVDRRLNIHMQFPNGVRGDRFDEELVALMKEAGTHYMAIAIETVSEKYQQLIRKNLKIGLSLETIHWANKYNIEVCGFFMIGFPGETREEVNETVTFAMNAPLDTIFISLVSPFKGTELRNDMLEGRFGTIDADGLEALDQLFPTVHNESLPIDELKTIQRNAYLRFYSRPRSVLNLGRKLTNRRNVNKIVRAVVRRIRPKETVSVN
jgi:anaerobic magnesium-protoporphyrin IX monomethyl ester cyclase